MSYFRSYFEKNNTLIKNSKANTSKSPTTELFYGDKHSKFIFKIDLTDLKNNIDEGNLVLNNNTKHILNLTNTIIGDNNLIGKEKINSKVRATSFDLIIFKIPQFWDEGVGFDVDRVIYDVSNDNLTYDERPSNWFKRTQIEPWTEDGVYYDDPIILKTIHFDNGNENINVDITDYINSVLTGQVDYGLGIGFAVPYQDIKLMEETSVSFFTKYTQTFFEPFLETVFEDTINDNRNDFICGIEQNLYLSVGSTQNSFDLDHTPTVDIINNEGVIIMSNLPTTKVTRGIYKVTFILNDTNADGRKFYTDKWKDLSYMNTPVDEVEQTFLPEKFNKHINFGYLKKSEEFSFRVIGLKQNEKIKRGDVRKVSLHYTTINKKPQKPFEKAYYRFYIKEGRTNVTVHDWTQMNKTDENYFMFDTSFYIPREYSVEFKIECNNEIKLYRDTINFEIISEK